MFVWGVVHLHTIAIVWCIVVRMEWLLLSLLSLKRVHYFVAMIINNALCKQLSREIVRG